MTEKTNRQIVLASRPTGEPTVDNFRLVDAPLAGIGPGQVALQTLYLSLDPYMRGRMSAAKSYAVPVAIGEVMVGGVVSRVLQSQHPDFKPGEIVQGWTGWVSPTK